MDSGYHKLARHFGWFLHQMFVEDKYDQVIILEVLLLLPLNHRTILKWLLPSLSISTQQVAFFGKILRCIASVHGTTMVRRLT